MQKIPLTLFCGRHPQGGVLCFASDGEGFEDLKYRCPVGICCRQLDGGKPYIFAKGKNE